MSLRLFIYFSSGFTSEYPIVSTACKLTLSGIFNKFFRAENASKERTDGSGLGLFVIKNIIETHGGTVGFESEENVGSTFFFTVPIAPEQAAPEAQEVRQAQQ